MLGLALGVGWFANLNNNDKGDLGEVIAGKVLREALRRDLAAFFDDDRDIASLNPHLPKRGHSPRPIACWNEDGALIEIVRTNWEPKAVRVGSDGDRDDLGTSYDYPSDRNWWEPDFRFTVSDHASDQEFEKEILCEVKTGKYAEFGRTQKETMLMANRHPDRLVLTCRVRFTEGSDQIQLRFRRLDVDDRASRARWTDLTDMLTDILPATDG